ncbi:E3 ubiquitin-protein ligase TRIM47-like [Scomber japonicus]|uniref:E3 ubiquitin-protein ligase TRIM47-like n=1 Tax=Scomber japonicus TaxID=13676 RepID=UPI0023064AA9|nr:E3 ubiquitin-protein ligase TRIM47-like [Scomber japonicus]
MANTDKTKLEEMLTCPVCQDIFKDPRQLPCGHSMCMSCLEGMVDHTSDLPFRCPDCRGYFGQVIGVQKSYALASIAEDFRLNRRTGEEHTESVYCDCCPEKTTLAMKTCLKCELSLCEEHVMEHLKLAVFTGHPLVKPLNDLKERKCPQHKDEVLKYYCNTSRRYICNLCALESKQDSLAKESSTVLRRHLTEYLDQRFNMLKEQLTESTDSFKKLQDDIRRDKEKAQPAESQLNSVTVVLLCLWFIVLYYAYNYSVENQTLTEALDKQQSRMLHVYSSIADLLVDRPTKRYTLAEKDDQVIPTLDLDTASPFLGISADLQTVERVESRLNYPSRNTRFDEAPQVLSTQCFSTGTHTWEVEAEGYWDIALSYQSIKRKNKGSSAFGNNPESWSLTHNGKGKLFAYHNNKKHILYQTLESNRVAVGFNFERGNITFSAVDSGVTTELHEFKAKLTAPLCLGLGLYRVDPPSRASIIKVS